ncbi:OmpP1/FadL family transporter [Lignipirellula cremea]|nr:outer membrane protein transport protein [Lignipirellula cremea]
MSRPSATIRCFCTLFLLMLMCPTWAVAQGVYAPGLGPINRSMGSAAVAAPLDGIGAIAWNPATLSGFKRSELEMSVELLFANIETSSSVAGIGGGATESDSGAMPLPNMGWVHVSPDSRLSIGFGVLSVAGFQTNFPASGSNPIFFPQRSGVMPIGGFGRVSSEAAFIDLAPTMAYAVTDQLSVGVTFAATMAQLNVEPLVFAGLNDANGDFASTYPTGQGSRYHWGCGANFGVFYEHTPNWRFGASVKTPRWMEDFKYQTQDENGAPLSARYSLDLPMVASVGTSYTDGDRFLMAVDVRYIDYENADGFGDSGLNPNGSLRGLGWESVFAVATGIQYRLTDTLTGRVGYVYNQNPIPDALTQLNVPAPLHYEHTLSCGFSYQPVPVVSFNVSYAYSLPSDITGPITFPPNAPTGSPAFPVPGSSVTSSLTAHALAFGITVAY